MFLCEAARSFMPFPLKNFVANTACSILITIDSGWTVKYIFSLRDNYIQWGEEFQHMGKGENWGGGEGGKVLKLWVGMCDSNLETGILFQTRICEFPHPLSDLNKKLIPHFRARKWAYGSNIWLQLTRNAIACINIWEGRLCWCGNKNKLVN